MNSNRSFLLTIVICVFTLSCSDDNEEIECNETIEELGINEYQTIGSHNSYRKNTQKEIAQLLRDSTDFVPPWFDPAVWDYSHETINDQLDIYQVRSLEFDVYRDPNGGLFYNRLGNQFVDLEIASGEEVLLEPGLKVLHFPDLDYNTHHLTFIDALENIKNWSSLNTKHLPLIVLVQAKEDSPGLIFSEYDLTETIPYENNSVEEIESEIKQVFSSNPELVLRPDDVRGLNSSLRGAINTVGWPKLKESRGKIIFVLLASNQIIEDYTTDHPNLEERNMFVFSDSLSSYSAFIKIDNPINNETRIRSLVDQGFMVRTRADANTYEAINNDYSRMYAAFNSGAQVISTDFYRPDPRGAMDSLFYNYQVKFPNNQLARIGHNILNPDNQNCIISE